MGHPHIATGEEQDEKIVSTAITIPTNMDEWGGGAQVGLIPGGGARAHVMRSKAEHGPDCRVDTA